MSEKKTIAECNQDGCDSPAAFRFTWPGKDEAGICAIHAVKLVDVARAMSLPLQIVPLMSENYMKHYREKATPPDEH